MQTKVKDIVVFGANCSKCKKAEATIRNVLAKFQIQANVTKCEDWDVMIKHNVRYLPTIMIDDIIKFKGIVPTEKEFIKSLI